MLEPVQDIHYIGCQITVRTLGIPKGYQEKSTNLLKEIDCKKRYDWKIIQCLVGHLNFLAGFSSFQWSFLIPLYAIYNKSDVQFSK